MPLLEAVENAALEGRRPRRRTDRERPHADPRAAAPLVRGAFDRIVVPAPPGREPGFTPKDLLWILTHAPSETVILRPQPEA